MWRSSLRLKHSASEHESWRTSVKSNVLNPVLFGQFVQLPASGKSDSSSFENGTDLRLRYTFCSIHACNLLAGTRLSEYACEVLQAWKKEQASNSPFLFPSPICPNRPASTRKTASLATPSK